MTTAVETITPRSRVGVATRTWGFVKRHALTVYALLAVVYLMLPIAVVILFSFNAPKSNFNYVWQGFTLDNWITWDEPLGISDAVVTSPRRASSRRSSRPPSARSSLSPSSDTASADRVRRTCSSSCRCRHRRSCSALHS